MKNLKKLLIIMICMSFMISKQVYANETITSGRSGITTATTTTINGKVAATIINVSVPTIMTFSIDPNNKETSCLSSVSSIKNLTKAPIEVSIDIGETNFKQEVGSLWKPVDVLPDEKDWEKLGVKESENNIALGVKINNKEEWRSVKFEDALWVKSQKNTSNKTIFGDINPTSEANVTLEVYHGFSFSEEKECSYNIIWSFALTED